MVPVECYFVLSALLFFIGVYGFITRRNLIGSARRQSFGEGEGEDRAAAVPQSRAA